MKYDVIVIGAGIVGLASAYRLLEAKPDLKLLILEKKTKKRDTRRETTAE